MATPGVYLFNRKGRTVYVGRSDSDVYQRMLRSWGQGPFAYDRNIKVIEKSSPRQAYLEECRQYHRHNPSDNSIHPAVPAGSKWRCPVGGCHWS
jgi:hypothetical protein